MSVTAPDPLAIFSAPPALEPPDLLDTVPPYEQSAYEVQAVLGVVANELARIEAAQQALTQNFFPATADALLPIFEQMLGLPVNPAGLTYAQRQSIVLAYMQRLKGSGSGLDWIASMNALAGTSWKYAEHLTNPPTNYVPDPSFEYDTIGSAPAAWSASAPAYWLNAGATPTVVTAQTYMGGRSLQVVTTAAASFQGVCTTQLPLPSGGSYKQGQPYTFAIWAKGNAGGETLQIALGIAGTDSANTTVTLTTAWQRFSVTWTPTANETVVYAVVRQNTAAARTFFLDAALVTEGTSAPAYFDGDTATYQWSGTAGNSTSFFSSPPANTISVSIPQALAGVGWPYIRDITPAHVAINQGYTGGFVVGVTNIGSNL